MSRPIVLGSVGAFGVTLAPRPPALALAPDEAPEVWLEMYGEPLPRPRFPASSADARAFSTRMSRALARAQARLPVDARVVVAREVWLGMGRVAPIGTAGVVEQVALVGGVAAWAQHRPGDWKRESDRYLFVSVVALARDERGERPWWHLPPGALRRLG